MKLATTNAATGDLPTLVEHVLIRRAIAAQYENPGPFPKQLLEDILRGFFGNSGYSAEVLEFVPEGRSHYRIIVTNKDGSSFETTLRYHEDSHFAVLFTILEPYFVSEEAGNAFRHALEKQHEVDLEGGKIAFDFHSRLHVGYRE